MNYENEYNEDRSRSDRWESHSFTDPHALASQIQALSRPRILSRYWLRDGTPGLYATQRGH